MTLDSNALDRPLNMLHFVPTAGEASAMYHEFVLALSSKHQVTVCTYFSSNISPPKGITLFEGDGSLKGFFRILRDTLNAQDYDIIHIHTPFIGFLFLIAAVLMFGRWMPFTVYTVHSSYPNYKFRNRLMMIPIFKFFQRIVCCSKASYASFPVFFKLLADKRICVIQNGVDIERIDRTIGNKQRCFPNNNITIATVGRLIESKNPFVILDIFQQINDQVDQLVFIGEGHLREPLIAQSQKLGIGERVKFTGLISKEEVYENLAQVDLFISTSRVEGLPIAVLEAMACRCPVILSDIPSHKEIVGNVGFIPLIHPDDVLGFVQAIKHFKRMSSSRQLEVGMRCRKLVEEQFGLTMMHEGYERVYAHVLDAKRYSR